MEYRIIWVARLLTYIVVSDSGAPYHKTYTLGYRENFDTARRKALEALDATNFNGYSSTKQDHN